MLFAILLLTLALSRHHTNRSTPHSGPVSCFCICRECLRCLSVTMETPVVLPRDVLSHVLALLQNEKDAVA